ncbi:MAG: AraC family transcriptional regulator [Cyanobacteria bacterium P01_D01_bin.1]
MDKVQSWKTSLRGIECYEAHLYHHRFEKHFHDAYTIGMNRSGAGQCVHQRRSHYHSPGSFNCINPAEIHTGEVAPHSDRWLFQNIYILPSALEQILTQLEQPIQNGLPCFSKMVIDDPSLQVAFQQAFNALVSTSAQKLEQQSKLLHFFAQLLPRHLQPLPAHRSTGSEHKTVQRVLAYLEAHCAKNITLDELGAFANLNPCYLIRCFHRQVGLPPHSYKKQCQLLGAKRSLDSEEAIATIALRWGFYDQSHLNRAFKKAYALTPGQYRAARR